MPIVVAVNKVDKEEADPNRVRTQMVEHGVVPSEWGGDNEFVDVSAQREANLDTLLETILVVADLEELKGDPTGRARGTVLEAHLDKGRGPVATVLVQKGTLEVGDALVCGTTYCEDPRDAGRERPDGRARRAVQAGRDPRLGTRCRASGDDFREVEDEREARHIAAEREARSAPAELVISAPADAAGPAPPGRARGDPRAEPGRQGRRPGLARRAHGRVPEAAAGRGAREHRAQRRRRHHRERRHARDGLATRSSSGFNVRPDTNAASSPRRKASTSARTGDLRRDRRHQGGALGHAQARGARARARRGRGPSDVPRAEARRDRRLLRHERHDPA